MFFRIDQKRGTLKGTQTAITSGTFEQQWGLDATGNWKTFNMEATEAIERLAKMNAEGGSELLNGTWELNQTRTANKVNEITGVTNSVGTAWATPTYDAAGNMIGVPNPPATITGTTPAWVPMTEAQWSAMTEAQWSAMTETTSTTPLQLSARYDAWNRLVLITNGTQKVSEHVYDARGYRIRKDTYTSGTLTEARHYYYTPGWQCVEERVGTSTTLERQFVWGLRYIDDLILRDRSTANNGTMDERRYAMQDGNWNTIAICDTSGSVGERYAYSAYGTPVFMTGAGVVQASSPIGFETLYAGYRYDGTTPQMYYVRNRFLLPMIGTWNQVDLSDLEDYGSLLEYSKSNPVLFVDHTGLYCTPPNTLCKPLTKQRLLQLVRDAGLAPPDATDAHVHQIAGGVFETFVQNSVGLTRNITRFNSPARAAATNGQKKAVVPDFVTMLSWIEQPPGGHYERYFNSSFVEAKAVAGAVNLNYDGYQTLGFLDVLSRSQAARNRYRFPNQGYPNPYLGYVTTSDTTIGPDVIASANRRKICLVQAVVCEIIPTKANGNNVRIEPAKVLSRHCGPRIGAVTFEGRLP